MVWIASNPPLDADDKKLYQFLRRKVGVSTARKNVLLFSLYKYLKTHKPRNIETSAYYDEAKTKPVFSSKTARALSTLMKQTGGAVGGAVGGAGDDAIVLDNVIRSMITYIQSWLPLPMSESVNSVYPYLTILKTFEEMPGIGPYIDIGKEAFVQGTTTAIVGANDIATDVGGPAGAVAVAIPSAIATFGVVITHMMEDELGEALLVSFLAVPFIGPTLYKAAGSLGKFGNKVSKHKDTIRVFLGDGMTDFLLQTQGGKRFSTRRRKVSKWRRTRFVKH
jgi:hypothetical protein